MLLRNWPAQRRRAPSEPERSRPIPQRRWAGVEGKVVCGLARDDRLRVLALAGSCGDGRGEHRKYLPYIFTEHGVVMAASVLNSPRAVEVSVFVVRAFVKLRQLVLAHKDLATKLDQLERKVGSHDEAIQQLVAAIRQLMAPPESPKNRIGFHTIRDSAKEQAEPSKPTASVKPPKRRRSINA